MRTAITLFTALILWSNESWAQGALENPVAGSTESSITVISGWHCTASNITVEIDGVNLGKAGSGTNRPDTASVCGHAGTGYSMLINYGELAPGSHTIRVHADGNLSETRQFNSIQSGGTEFVTGLSKTVTVSDFPSSGRTAILEWREAKQSFVITQVSATPPSLTWSPSVSQEYRWSEADTYCTTSNINGQPGWRLPTQPELTSLAQSGTRVGEGGIWSSTPAQPTYHYMVSLNGTTGTAYSYPDYSYLHVLCVK